MTTPITHSEYLLIGAIPAGVDLVAEVRSLNSAGVEIPWAWNLIGGPDEKYMLTYGVNNDVGVLVWDDGEEYHVPTCGTNPDWVIYHLAGMHELRVQPHAQVSVENVYAALAQFLRTGQRPTCVLWQSAPSITSWHG